jgi:hypothetical protein
MESVGTIKTWEPPKKFVVETTEGPGTVATEWTVEARSGGTCVVRVLHRWFSESDDWDQQFEGHTYGWQAFFRNLRLYLAHFFGQPSAAFQLLGVSTESQSAAWNKFVEDLGLANPVVGEQRATKAGAPTLSGIVERVGDEAHPEILLRLNQPAPGIGHLFAMPMGGMVFISARFYLFGDHAAAAVTREEPIWREWLFARFPAPSFPGC